MVSHPAKSRSNQRYKAHKQPITPRARRLIPRARENGRFVSAKCTLRRAESSCTRKGTARHRIRTRKQRGSALKIYACNASGSAHRPFVPPKPASAHAYTHHPVSRRHACARPTVVRQREYALRLRRTTRNRTALSFSMLGPPRKGSRVYEAGELIERRKTSAGRLCRSMITHARAPCGTK